jgi:hypothetical protein
MRWLSTAVPPANYDVCFQLVSEGQPTAAEKATCLPITANYPTSQWPQNEVIRANYRLPISDQTPPAEYQLSLTLVNSEDGAMSETAVLGQITIHPNQTAFPVSATWNDQIQLLGYDLTSEEGSLSLNPFWQAVAPMENSNKLFVHLVNAADGQIAAQQDMIPLNWSYPTFVWEANEIIRDTILLDTSQLPSGTYQIWLGWYQEFSGTRLQTSAGEERIYLQDVLIENE